MNAFSLQDVPNLQAVFIELGGLNTLAGYLEQCLAETVFIFPKELLPMIIRIYRSIVVNQNSLIHRVILTENGDFLYSMLRCAFLFPDDHILKQDLSVLLLVLLFDDAISNDGHDESPYRISLPNFFHQNLNLPVTSGITDVASPHEVRMT